MTIWTEVELDHHIVTWKQVLLGLAAFKQTTGPGGRTLTLEDSPEARNNLRYFAQEKKKLAGTSLPGINAGRAAK